MLRDSRDALKTGLMMAYYRSFIITLELGQEHLPLVTASTVRLGVVRVSNSSGTKAGAY
jgi:hypothetical protein